MRRSLAIVLLLATVGCAGRRETMRYAPGRMPPWILEKWRRAQEELLELPDLRDDPRRFGPDEWSWVQMEKAFSYTDADTGKRERVGGLTLFESRQILVCCGDRETVRHEAFHAMLWRMGDPRYALHYSELRP